MTETTQAPTTENNAPPLLANSAIEICDKAYARAHKAARSRSQSQLYAKDEAEKAFRRAMPTLSEHDNIRDFIACVAYGMLIKAITGPEGARLLYAAQVANNGGGDTWFLWDPWSQTRDQGHPRLG